MLIPFIVKDGSSLQNLAKALGNFGDIRSVFSWERECDSKSLTFAGQNRSWLHDCWRCGQWTEAILVWRRVFLWEGMGFNDFAGRIVGQSKLGETLRDFLDALLPLLKTMKVLTHEIREQISEECQWVHGGIVVNPEQPRLTFCDAVSRRRLTRRALSAGGFSRDV